MRRDGIHLASDARVVHHHDRARPRRRDRSLDLHLVDVQRVGPDVDEHRHAAAQHEGVGSRDEGERRHDDLVARPDAGEDRGQLEGRSARLGEQRRVAAGRLLQPRLASPGERPVA